MSDAAVGDHLLKVRIDYHIRFWGRRNYVKVWEASSGLALGAFAGSKMGGLPCWEESVGVRGGNDTGEVDVAPLKGNQNRWAIEV